MPNLILVSEGATTVMEKGLANTSSVLTLLGDVTNFIVNNELCLLFLGFMFVSRGVGVLRKCLRVTPR